MLVASILCGSLFLLSYFNLDFCFKILAQNNFNNMCNRYKKNEYSGTLCQELCTDDTFKDFKCPEKLYSAIFTASQNYHTYAIKMAKHTPTDSIAWKDKEGLEHYPKTENFQNIIKGYVTIFYNITIDDDAVRALFNQDINSKEPEQMKNIWRLFKDNSYMMGKLYEEESIFPTVFGTCGPFYSTEYLRPVKLGVGGLRQFFTSDWAARLKFAMIILEYLHRLEEIKPEPLRICKFDTNSFGITADKRIKFQNAHFILPQSELDKLLSGGVPCASDEDCFYESCLGKCDLKRHICSNIQQNNNYQIMCKDIFKGYRFFPGILSTSKTPDSLFKIINICIDPSTNPKHHNPNRIFAPSQHITLRLYNEIQRIYNEETFHQ